MMFGFVTVYSSPARIKASRCPACGRRGWRREHLPAPARGCVSTSNRSSRQLPSRILPAFDTSVSIVPTVTGSCEAWLVHAHVAGMSRMALPGYAAGRLGTDYTASGVCAKDIPADVSAHSGLLRRQKAIRWRCRPVGGDSRGSTRDRPQTVSGSAGNHNRCAGLRTSCVCRARCSPDCPGVRAMNGWTESLLLLVGRQPADEHLRGPGWLFPSGAPQLPASSSAIRGQRPTQKPIGRPRSALTLVRTAELP